MKKELTVLFSLSLAACAFGAQTIVGISGCKTGRLEAMSDSANAQIGRLFDWRIAKIRATPNMEIPAGANCRYISPKGDDAADGRTPATAWRTPARLKEETLEPGSFCSSAARSSAAACRRASA